MLKSYVKYRKYISVIFTLFLLCSFYQLGVPFPAVVALGTISIALIFLKDSIRTKSNVFINEKLLFLDKSPAWLKKAIVLLFFLLIIYILKQTIFLILKIAGINLQEIISDSINKIQR